MLHLPEFGRGGRDKRWIVLLRTYSRSHAQANAGAADSRSDTSADTCTYYVQASSNTCTHSYRQLSRWEASARVGER